MAVRTGRDMYADRYGKTTETDLKTVASTSKIGLGRVRHLAQKGNAEARQVLRDLDKPAPADTDGW